MKILIIELCNYINIPTGGQLSFVKNMISACGDDLALVGYAINDDMPLHQWTRTKINHTEFDYFAISRIKQKPQKPLLPARLSGFWNIFRLRRKILSIDYDIILFQAPEVLLALPGTALTKSVMRMPGVENALSISRYKWARKIAHFYEKIFFSRAKDIPVILATADSTEIKDFISRSDGKIYPSKVIQFPTRFDSNYFYSMAQTEARQILNWDYNKKIILTVGRLAEFKGWRLMLEAFAILYNKDSSYIMYFIGDGEDEMKIRSFIADAGIQEAVVLLGRQSPDYIGKALNAADVFIMGSMFEGWSTSLVEACACGVPCVVTKFSSAGDMINNGINGYVVCSRSAQQFSEMIEKAIMLDRESVIRYNKCFENLSVQNLKNSFYHTIAMYENKLSDNE